jgi:L-rhamnose isomerase
MSEADVRAALRALPIELPSWGFGNAGTRFGVFPEAGAPATYSRRSRTPPRSTG